MITKNTVNDQLHTRFLTLVPRFERHARIMFRDVKCAFKRADCIAETLALCWKWFVRLAKKGKDAAHFPSALVTYVARAVRTGRRLCGQEKMQDVLSPVAQREHNFVVESLPNSTRRKFADIYALVRGQEELDAYEDRLRDNGVTPPPDAAAFRIDFPQFLAGLTERDRDLAMHLSLGHSTTHAATKFGLTPGRVSQLRRLLQGEWRKSQGEENPDGQRGAASRERRLALA